MVIRSCVGLVAAAVKEARRDQRVHDGVAERGVERPQPTHLPPRQGQAWHLEILRAHALNPLCDWPFRRHDATSLSSCLVTRDAHRQSSPSRTGYCLPATQCTRPATRVRAWTLRAEAILM